jgi:serine/threonine protein kinase/WD40 repeat protein/tetratricopeptide (TPR) repeat protein
MNSQVANSAPSQADPAFDLLVDHLIAQIQAGEAVDWRQIAQEHPRHAGRLRSLAGALEALGDLSSASDVALSGAVPPSAQEEFVPGVLGDFRILREVGRGGMGVVYEAEQVSLNRCVALKVLPLAATMDPRQLDRFRHEARAAALLHHPHIVPVYGVGCERGVHYYAMQLIDGCSLANVIAERRGPGEGMKNPPGEITGPYLAAGRAASTQRVAALATVPILVAANPFRRIAELVAQAADALEYAHTMGVVHRDVKPANLLLDTGGNVWVADFGLARLGEGPGLTLPGDVLGTLRYMSPEQALARHGLVDHRTDVYSLGATLYELLTRHPAVDGASKEEILHRLAFEEPICPRKLDRSIPAELETVALKALARNPQERYATAAELADDLRRWLSDRPILARPPGPIQRLRKWCHRHRPLVVAVAVFLTLLVAGLCLGAVAYGVRKGELADEWSRFAEEKERSRQNIAAELRQVLVDRAESIRLARPPGYRRRVWADLRQALAQPATGAGGDQVRATVLASLGDPVALDPVSDVTAVRRRKQPRLPEGSEQWVREAANSRAVAVSADGNRIAVAGPRHVTIYSREGKPIRQEQSPLGGIYDLVLAADGKVLVAGCEHGFVAWDLAESDRWVVRVGNVFSVAISPSGRLVAAAGRQVELWSLAGKRLLASWLSPETGARVEFSADGRVLLAAVKGVPAVGWPVSDTPERRLLDGHAQGVAAIAFRPDGRLLVSVSRDRPVQLWDTATGTLVHTLSGHSGEIESVAYSPDGSLLATGDRSGRIRLWDARSGKLLTEAGRNEIPGEVWQLRFGPGGEYLAAVGTHIAAWTVRTAAGKVTLERLCTLASRPGSPGVIDLAVMPGGTELVYLYRSGHVCSYDLSCADRARPVANARPALRSLHFTPSGDRLTIITPGGTLGLWDWRTKKIHDTHRRAELVALSPDGRWAAIGEPAQKVTVIELASGREVLALPPEGSDIWCLSWAPDRKKLAVGLSDGTIAVWDLEQVRARLAKFGFDLPSLTPRDGTGTRAPVPAFEHVIHVSRLRVEAERGRRLAAEARKAGNYAEERDQLLTAMKRDGQLARILPDTAGHRKRLANTHSALARVHARLGDNEAILRHLQVHAKLLKGLESDEPENPDLRRLPGVSYHNVGFELVCAGRWAEAKQWYRAAMTAHDQLAKDVPAMADDPKFRTERATTLHNLGVLLARSGETAAAEKRLREAAAVRSRLADDFPTNPDYASNTGRTLEWLGGVLRDLGKLDESVRVFREAVRRQGAAVALRPTDPVFRELCANHQGNLAAVLASFILFPLILEQYHVPSLVATIRVFAHSLFRAQPAWPALFSASGKAGGPHGPQLRGSGSVRPAGGGTGRGDGAFRGQDRAPGRRDG